MARPDAGATDDSRALAPDLTGGNDPLLAIGYKVASTGVFSAMGAMVKAVGDDLPLGQILFARNAFALLPILVLVIWFGGGLRTLRTRRPVAHVLRAGVGLTGMVLGFMALTLLPLADATAIGFAAPLFTTVLAAIILREDVRRYRWTAVGIGFIGVVLILQPSGLRLLDPAALAEDRGYAIGALLGLGAACCVALATIIIRRMVDSEPGPTIVFYFTLSGTIAGALSLPFAAVWPGAIDAVLLILIGVLGGIGQLLLTAAYQKAGASTIAPFDYTAMLWALLIGVFIFDEVPAPIMLVGAAVVVGAGLYILYRERVRGVVRRTRRVNPPI